MAGELAGWALSLTYVQLLTIPPLHLTYRLIKQYCNKHIFNDACMQINVHIQKIVELSTPSIIAIFPMFSKLAHILLFCFSHAATIF